MKNIFVYIIVITGVLIACENQPVEFENYDLQAVYFPYQSPLRTLSLGEDRIDNSLDKEGKFDIGVSIGGMYSNNWDWTVDYVVDNSLVNDAYTNTDPPLKILPLPSEYYTITPANTFVINKGSFNGLARVELTDAFFNDPVSITGLYVISLRLTDTSADNILVGAPARENPDRRILTHWETNKFPKDWTMYGIKFINAYHGAYLHRGRNITVITETGEPVDTVIFRNRYVEHDMVIRLTTIGRNKVVSNGLGIQTGGDYAMTLEFDNDTGASGSVTITPAEGSAYSVTGSGQYLDKENSTEQWTGMTWQSMYLNYSYEDGEYTHNISDTLVFRDRQIRFEENDILVRP